MQHAILQLVGFLDDRARRVSWPPLYVLIGSHHFRGMPLQSAKQPSSILLIIGAPTRSNHDGVSMSALRITVVSSSIRTSSPTKAIPSSSASSHDPSSLALDELRMPIITLGLALHADAILKICPVLAVEARTDRLVVETYLARTDSLKH